MQTFRDLARYLRIYRRYIGRRMYLVFALTAATALAQGFGITLLLPLLKASQAGGVQAVDNTLGLNVAVARIVFDDGTQHRLGIDGRRPQGFSDYQKFARVALRGKPDLAEQLGLSAPSA